MNHLFVPYELALKLKEKGFDEPCFGWYLSDELKYFQDTPFESRTNKDFVNRYFNPTTCAIAPLYQQVIDWFREKHNIRFQENYWDGVDSWNMVKQTKENEFTSEQSRVPLNKAIEEALKLIP